MWGLNPDPTNNKGVRSNCEGWTVVAKRKHTAKSSKQEISEKVETERLTRLVIVVVIIFRKSNEIPLGRSDWHSSAKHYEKHPI